MWHVACEGREQVSGRVWHVAREGREQVFRSVWDVACEGRGRADADREGKRAGGGRVEKLF